MELLLPFNVDSSPAKISYCDKMLFMGSCFTEEIGNRMKEVKFDLLQNPNGILYDPESISAALNSYIENRDYKPDDLFFLNDLWHCWDHHSVFSGVSKEVVLQKINQSQASAHQFLKKASWIIITPGTSYKYYLQSGKPVANCHKAPSSSFQKKLLATEFIISELSSAISKLQLFNPSIKIIFTVSPVRHVRDGVVENNRSKARLIEATHFIKDNFDNVFYFPSYELLIDVLRDYRFYKEDHVHPTNEASRFIFEKFCDAFIEEEAIKLMNEVQSIISAVNHKPFHADSDAHKKFKTAQLEKIKKITRKLPTLDFSREEQFFS